MTQFEDIYDYKNRLMRDLLTSEEIVKLLDPTMDVSHGSDLAYKQVFPYEYVPLTEEEGKTFICFDVDIQKSLNKTYLLPTLYIWVFSHRSTLRLPDGGGVRPDKICCEIAKRINGSRYYGLGELDLYSTKRFAPMTDYQGKCMVFDLVEFNRTYDNRKQVPGNRKTG